jgi:hypothetical protein
MTIFADEGHSKRVSRCIRILSDNARHKLVIIAKHGRDSLVVIAAEERSVSSGATGAWVYG